MYAPYLLHICRYRVKVSASIAEVAKREWVPPSPGGVHWDGKIMQALNNKYKLEDRLPILVSGEWCCSVI